MSVEETVQISLGKCRHLTSPQGYNFTTFSRLELGNVLLGESTRLDYKIEDDDFSFGLDVKHICKVSDPLSIDELARNPLLVSVWEVLPKDKKAKEEKTHLLGVANVDLIPLLQGQTRIEQWLKLHPLEVAPPTDEQSPLPEIEVVVSVERLLLTPDIINNSNFLSLRVKGLYSLPDGWSPGQQSPPTFTVAIPRPLQSTDDPSPISITGGEIKAAGEVDLAQTKGLWKWAGLNSTTTGVASLMNDSVLEVNAVEDESGQLTSSQDVEFRRSAESQKPRVIWNSEARAYLSPINKTTLLMNLSLCPIWPVEVVKVVTHTGRGKGKEEETILSHHGMAYIDMSSLLYPGVTRVFGAYCVQIVNETDLTDKTSHVHTKSIVHFVHKSSIEMSGGGKKSINGGKRPSTAVRTSMASVMSQNEVIPEDNKADGQVYVDAKTYILLELELAEPLVPKRPPSVIAEKISEYIPPHPPVPRILGGVERATNDFHASTADVVGLLLADYRSLFGSVLEENGHLENTDEACEERKRQLFYKLNTSGHYHAYKEHLKKSVVSLVREKFLNEASVKEEGEMQTFLSKLYTYLVDEMHTALSKVFTIEDSATSPPILVDCDMLRQYAKEAELMLDLELAEHYHKELLSREEHIALHWYDYGVFSLLKRDVDHSEQCFKQAVALDQLFVPALLLYGMCCSLDERYMEANDFMELATTIDTANIIAWTMRGLCYELASNTIYSDMCYDQARKVNNNDKEKTYITAMSSHQGNEELEIKSQKSIEISESLPHTENQLENLSEYKLSQSNILQENQGGTPPIEEKEPNIEEEKSKENSPIVEENVQVKEKEVMEERLSPFLQTAAYLLDVNASKYSEMCLAHEYILQKQIILPETRSMETVEEEDSLETSEDEVWTSSEDYHISVARLHMLQGQYETAEKHLVWAAKENILNPNSWALLGHCHYLSDKLPEARDCYKRVIEYATSPVHITTVLLRLADIYMRNKEYTKAKITYLRACRKTPSNVTWRGVGIACYKLEQYSEAEDALSEANVLNNLDPVTWAYLALVCHQSKRTQEATQAVNFAIKTGLNDPSLLEQLHTIPS